MMTIIKAVLLLLFFNLSVLGQNSEYELHKIVISKYKNFIGSPFNIVKSFWGEKISSVYIHEQENNSYLIMFGDIGNPDFDALFDKGKCVRFDLLLYVKELSIIQTKLQNSGYIYNIKGDFWDNKTTKQWCKFEQLGGHTSQIMQATFAKGELPKTNIKSSPDKSEKKETLKLVTETNPKDATGFINRGRSKYLLKDYKGMVEDNTRAIELNPTSDTAYSNRGFGKYYLYEYQGAIQDFNKAIELNPMMYKTYFFRGNAKNSINDNKGAIDDYSIAIELKPEFAEAYSGRGLIKYYLKQYKDAIEDFSKAIELNPQYADAYKNRGLAKLFYGDEGPCLDWSKGSELGDTQSSNYKKNHCK